MRRLIGVLALGFALTLSANAHFVMVVPNAENTSAKVIFSDDLEPDENIPLAKYKGTKLTLRDAAGKETALEMTEAKGHFTVVVPGNGNRVIYGTTNYGVVQKGENKPFRLTYYPKAVLGIVAETQKVGEALPVEIVPHVADGKIRFQFLAKGKAVAETEINVMVPKEEKGEKLTTDKDGFTKQFDAKGTYGVWARSTDPTAGELDGKKYDESRSYATLVVEFAGK